MQFRLELNPTPSSVKLIPGERIALMGSCFTTHMAARLRTAKFPVLENPFGIVFNPITIAYQIGMLLERRKFANEDLFEANELFNSWHFHGSFSMPDANNALEAMNGAVTSGHDFLQTADWLILTLGSAFTYRLHEGSANAETGYAVANCHKVAANRFIHSIEPVQLLKVRLKEAVEACRKTNPAVKIVFTISPVRHYREGLIENNRSKSALHLAVMDLCNEMANTHYFPAYELVIDDLRDYRFYAEDLVHPNYAATDYVWEKFTNAYFDEAGKIFLDEIQQLRLAVQHKPHHPGSALHQKFRSKMLDYSKNLQKKYPVLDFRDEICFFS